MEQGRSTDSGDDRWTLVPSEAHHVEIMNMGIGARLPGSDPASTTHRLYVALVMLL